MSKKTDIAVTQNQPISTVNNETPATPSVTQEPAQDASTDAIIDYIVDGQSGDETKAAQATLETKVVADSEPTINTNF